jgi:hypothetical protein
VQCGDTAQLDSRASTCATAGTTCTGTSDVADGTGQQLLQTGIVTYLVTNRVFKWVAASPPRVFSYLRRNYGIRPAAGEQALSQYLTAGMKCHGLHGRLWSHWFIPPAPEVARCGHAERYSILWQNHHAVARSKPNAFLLVDGDCAVEVVSSRHRTTVPSAARLLTLQHKHTV